MSDQDVEREQLEGKTHCHLILHIFIFLIMGGIMCSSTVSGDTGSYLYKTYPLERNGVALHLDCMTSDDNIPSEDILLLHGSSYSSHEFDIDYQDYSLVRRLAREGYAVWRLDIAGYGQSGAVEDGFAIDTAYAAEDINAAVERIVELTGHDQIDVLGWSWGTMTGSSFASQYPAHVRKLILYAPILSGLGKQDIGEEAFSHNTWESAAEDFQKNADGSFDLNATDPVMIEMFCSSCWHYDGESSPRGWAKDALVDEDVMLIDLKKITVPTLLIYGSKDPYMNFPLLDESLTLLPEGSERRMIEGGSHALMYEKNCYKEFQASVVSFLRFSENS